MDYYHGCAFASVRFYLSNDLFNSEGMTIKEMILKTGHLPNRVVFENGNVLQLFTSIETTGSYFVGLWCMVDNKKEHPYAFGFGASEDEAKEDLKQKLLK